jgi:hypothetical protein
VITRRSLLQTTLLASVAKAAPSERFVGMTVMPEDFQVEGIENVLGALRKRAGVTAVATAPYVMEPSDVQHGVREPPIDAGAGKVRLLDRPLWGRRELYVTTAPSFVPNPKLYEGMKYRPSEANELTRREGRIVRDFIRTARDRGFRTYFQIEAAIPPGYIVQSGGPLPEDRPLLPNGKAPAKRVGNTASLASEEMRRYTNALIADLCNQYPEIDGIRPDWPEYPQYLLDDAFLDFSPAAKQAAERLGFRFEQMQHDSADLYAYVLERLTNRDLEIFLARDGEKSALLAAAHNYPGFLELCRFKSVLVDELLAGFRRALDPNKHLVPNAFPRPFTIASGMDYSLAAKHSSGISVKLYTMHWPMIVRFYGDALLAANRGLSDHLLAAALVRLMDIADGPGLPRIADYAYPDPDTPHPVGREAQARKIHQAQIEAGATPIYALVHGYGPLADFKERLKVAWKASNSRIWINRYGYLTDQKIEAIGEVTAA